MKRFLVLVAIFINCIVGGTIAALVGAPPVWGAVGLNAVAAASPLFAPDGALRAGIYTEVWTGEMIKAFRDSVASLGWIDKIRSYDHYAQHNVIHFVHIGGDPSVLVNNTTYPIGVENLQDADKAISLDKYQTLASRITDDELHAICYDKMASVLERHKEVINAEKYKKALLALAPTSHSDQTPVLITTGTADGTRVRLRREDIIALKKAFDVQKIPTDGRVLVLCAEHVGDLLTTDQKFAEQYYNYTTGKIANLYGFEVYEYNESPYYTVSSRTKLAYKAVPTPATDRQASVAFYAPRMMKATGDTKAYLSAAESNPETQENLANFRHYFICLPLKEEAIGAIVSGIATT
jgi:hypothetical protein